MSADNSMLMSSGISDSAQKMLDDFWPEVMEDIKKLGEHQYKSQELPLARIKKIMKLDEDVKMISAEAPVLFAKAAEIFVRELSLRAWIHTEDNKRRTLQRNDIAMAISKYDQFDFLIDIVPREDLKPNKRQDELSRGGNSIPDQIQYYLQLAHQQSQQQSHQSVQQTSQQQPQQQTQPQQAQVSQAAPVLQQLQQTAVQQQQQPQQQPAAVPAQAASVQLPGGQIIQQQFQIQQSTQPQVIQLPQQIPQVVNPVQNTVMQHLQQQQQQQQQQQHIQTQAQQQQPSTQVYQQVITQSGQVETVPIQLTPQQLQSLQLQLQNKVAGQQIVLQSQQAGDQTTQFAQAQPMYELQQAQEGQQQIVLQAEAAAGKTTES